MMAVALKTFEEFGHRNGEVKHPELKLEKRAGTNRVEYEFPYDDLTQMYDYITQELGIR
jgi:hypothetical protein